MNLFSEARVTVVDEVTSAGLEITSLEYAVDLQVTAENLWQKQYEVLPRRSAPENGTGITCGFELPLARLLEDISKITKEVGMGSPDGSYRIACVFRTWTKVDGSEAATYEYAPTITFTVARSGLTLEPPKEDLASSQKYSSDLQVERPSSRQFLGRDMITSDLKQATAGILAMVLAAELPIMLWVAQMAGAAKAERSRKRDPARHYRDKLIAASGLDVGNLGVLVRVAGLKELARIADDAQVAIMELDDSAKQILPELELRPNPELQGRRFFAVVGGTVYYVV